jgi:hypothetical protein
MQGWCILQQVLLTIVMLVTATQQLAATPLTFPYTSRCQLLIGRESAEKADKFQEAVNKLSVEDQKRVELGLKELVQSAIQRPTFASDAEFANAREALISLLDKLDWQPLLDYLAISDGVPRTALPPPALRSRSGFESSNEGLESMMLESVPSFSIPMQEGTPRGGGPSGGSGPTSRVTDKQIAFDNTVYERLSAWEVTINGIMEILGATTSAEKAVISPVIAKVDQVLLQERIDDVKEVRVRFEYRRLGYTTLGGVIRDVEKSKIELAQASVRLDVLSEYAKRNPEQAEAIGKIKAEFEADLAKGIGTFSGAFFDARALRQHIETVALSEGCTITCRARAIKLLAESGVYDEIAAASSTERRDPLVEKLQQAGLPELSGKELETLEKEISESYWLDWQAVERIARNPETRRNIMQVRFGRELRRGAGYLMTSDIVWQLIYKLARNIPGVRKALTFHANETQRLRNFSTLLTLMRENLDLDRKIHILKNLTANDPEYAVVIQRLSDISQQNAAIQKRMRELEATEGGLKMFIRQMENALPIAESQGPISASFEPGLASRALNYGTIVAAVVIGVCSHYGINVPIPFAGWVDDPKVKDMLKQIRGSLDAELKANPEAGNQARAAIEAAQ